MNKLMLLNQHLCQFFDQIQWYNQQLLALPIQQSPIKKHVRHHEHVANWKHHHHENQSMKQHQLVHDHLKPKLKHRLVHRKPYGDHIKWMGLLQKKKMRYEIKKLFRVKHIWILTNEKKYFNSKTFTFTFCHILQSAWLFFAVNCVWFCFRKQWTHIQIATISFADKRNVFCFGSPERA